MRWLKTFYSMILRKNDADFWQQSSRDGVVQVHSDLTGGLGGVISGLDVYKSIDGMSLLITPGIFYNGGSYNPTNGLGGGERGQVFTTQTFTGLPSTPPIGNQPSYLVVYAKTINQNYNPDPTQSQTIVTSKNIQTGENIPTRQYTTGSIVISNPVLLSQVNLVDGVPLAIIQVDYIGTNASSTSGSIQVIDSTYKRAYTIGGTIDVLNKTVTNFKDNFVVNNMLASGSVYGDSILSSAITSDKIATWDGTTLYNDITGSGVANQHLKDGAVTEDKINNVSGLNNFSQYNLLANSSFELGNTTLTNWTSYAPTVGSSITLTSAESLYGTKAVKFVGTASPTAQPVSISQTVYLNGDKLNNRPISAFFYIKTPADFSTSIVGTNGINGVIEFLSNDTVVQTNIFATYSGVQTDWMKMETSEPLVYTGVDPITKISMSISGNFADTVYVDGAFLGITSKIPAYSAAVQEQITITNLFDASQITSGEFGSDRIQDGSILTRHIAEANIAGGGISGTQIMDLAITNNNIADYTIAKNKLVQNSVDSSVLDTTIWTKMLPTAWCVYNGAVLNSYNIASAVRNGDGAYTFTFTTPMTTKNYCVVFGGDSGGVLNYSWLNVWANANSTASVYIYSLGDAPAGRVKDRLLNFVIFGGR